MSDFWNSSLFRKFMKKLIDWWQCHNFAHPISQVAPPLKLIVYSCLASKLFRSFSISYLNLYINWNSVVYYFISNHILNFDFEFKFNTNFTQLLATGQQGDKANLCQFFIWIQGSLCDGFLCPIHHLALFHSWIRGPSGLNQQKYVQGPSI